MATLLVPPIALIAGALVLGEDFGAGQIGGLDLIAVGLAVIDGRVLSLWPARPRQAA